MLKSLDNNQQIKIINTINKMLFDVNSVLQKDNNESFEIGVRLKNHQEQDYLFTVFSTIFNDHTNINVISKKDDDDRLIVCIIRD
tara:strand:- start:162 stop:416 length:255 start_codon:yes stop_codon:yes gene_type:complete